MKFAALLVAGVLFLVFVVGLLVRQKLWQWWALREIERNQRQ